MAEDTEITPIENGPNRVTGGSQSAIPVARSSAWPARVFCCAGAVARRTSHSATGSTAPTGSMARRSPTGGQTAARREAFRAPGITIFDDRSICAHIGNGTDNLAQVFKSGVEPWIDASAATPDAIAAVFNGCPSGALSYVLDDAAQGDATGDEPPRPSEVRPLLDGPNAVTGGVPIVSPDGQSYEIRDRCALCRCGDSTNKPFCSGAHWNNGFKAEGF
jgi:uncharacterized Fe-S cluster protein YjdI